MKHVQHIATISEYNATVEHTTLTFVEVVNLSEYKNLGKTLPEALSFGFYAVFEG